MASNITVIQLCTVCADNAAHTGYDPHTEFQIWTNVRWHNKICMHYRQPANLNSANIPFGHFAKFFMKQCLVLIIQPSTNQVFRIWSGDTASNRLLHPSQLLMKVYCQMKALKLASFCMHTHLHTRMYTMESPWCCWIFKALKEVSLVFNEQVPNLLPYSYKVSWGKIFAILFSRIPIQLPLSMT